jgi:hypothetical protein
MQKASSHRVHSMAPFIGPIGLITLMGLMGLMGPMPAAEWTRLLHIVCNRLQVLFHSPSRGSFHLSLAVLVHYRLPRSI